MFSKETLDRVKLAKQFIESTPIFNVDRYQTIILQEEKNKQNWNKILTIVGPAQNINDIINNLSVDINANKRMQRQKDHLKNYKLYSVIGRGAFGEVRLARNIETSLFQLILDQVVAIKRLQKQNLLEKKQVYNAYIERDFMSKNSCPFIVQLKSTFQDEDYLYIAMEYAQGGDLLHLLIEKDILSEEQTKFYIAEMVQAVEQIHKMNYIHRDIKPDNILIGADGHIKVSDFGLSKYLEYENETECKEEKQKKGKIGSREEKKLSKVQKIRKLDQIKNKDRTFSKVGTPDYISPQVLIEKRYTHSVDIWGIGVIMFECLFGYPPFSDETSKLVCHKVANWIEYLEFPDQIKVSTAAKMLILGLINDNNKRLTIDQIKSHPFFDGIDWQNLSKMQPPFVPKVKDDLDSSNFDSYELKNAWTSAQKKFLFKINTNPKSRQRSAHKDESGDESETEDQENISKQATQEIFPFKFAGFDFRRVDQDPVESMATQLMRKAASQKCFKKNFSAKKMGSTKHEKSEKTNKFKLMKPKTSSSNGKSRASGLHNLTQISNSKKKLSPMKEILKNLSSPSKQKENVKMNFTFNTLIDPQSVSLKKKITKSKLEKIQQIYRASSQKKPKGRKTEGTCQRSFY